MQLLVTVAKIQLMVSINQVKGEYYNSLLMAVMKTISYIQQTKVAWIACNTRDLL